MLRKNTHVNPIIQMIQKQNKIMEEFRFEITEVDEGDRIDKFLTENIETN